MSSHGVEIAKETVLSWLATANTSQKVGFIKQMGKFLTLPEIKMTQNVLCNIKKAGKKFASEVSEGKKLPKQVVPSKRPTFSRDGLSQLNESFDSKCSAKSPIPSPSRPDSSGATSSNNSPIRDNRVRCPVKMCREKFDSYGAFSHHIQTVHTNWNRECVICGVKFEKVNDICDHLINIHGSGGEKCQEEGRMAALSRDDVETGFIIKQEVEIDAGSGLQIKEEIDKNENDEIYDVEIEIGEEWDM